MFETAIEQYMLIGAAVLVLLAIKYYAVNKSYQNKLQQFIHPQYLIDDVKKKLKKIPGYDTRILLSENLAVVEQDPSKMRNIALLICLMKENNTNLDPFHPRIKSTLNQIPYDTNPEYIRQYRDYILS